MKAIELRNDPVLLQIGFPTQMEVTRPWGSFGFAARVSPPLSPPSLHALSVSRARVKFVGGLEGKLAHCADILMCKLNQESLSLCTRPGRSGELSIYEVTFQARTNVFRKIPDSQSSQRTQIPVSSFLGFFLPINSCDFLLLRRTRSAGIDADFSGKRGTWRQRSWAEGLRILGQQLLWWGEVLGFMREDEESIQSLRLKLLREKQSRERYKNVKWNHSSRLKGFGFSGLNPFSTGTNLAFITENQETRRPMIVHERVEESRNRSPEGLAFTLEKHSEELGSRRGDEETDLETWEQVSEDAQKCSLQGSGFMIPKPTRMQRKLAYMISNREVMDEGFWCLTGDHREKTLHERSSVEDAEFVRHANNFKVSVEAYQETEIEFEIDLDTTPPDLGADREFGDWCGYWVGPGLDDGWGYVTAFIS